jgi:pimeloyl-ACP methyl ester carboxylesterase
VAYRLVRVLAKRGLLSAARLEKARQKYGSADYRAAHGLLRDILVTTVNEDYSAELATLSVPTAFVWGSDDTAATCTMAQRALEIPQIRPSWRMLEGVGHMVPLVAPASLTAAVTEMVQ